MEKNSIYFDPRRKVNGEKSEKWERKSKKGRERVRKSEKRR
jgi:hypothetical protein